VYAVNVCQLPCAGDELNSLRPRAQVHTVPLLLPQGGNYGNMMAPVKSDREDRLVHPLKSTTEDPRRSTCGPSPARISESHQQISAPDSDESESDGNSVPLLRQGIITDTESQTVKNLRGLEVEAIEAAFVICWPSERRTPVR